MYLLALELHQIGDDLLEKSGDDIVDALALGQDIAKLCWDLEVCGDRDEELFDFVEEDICPKVSRF